MASAVGHRIAGGHEVENREPHSAVRLGRADAGVGAAHHAHAMAAQLREVADPRRVHGREVQPHPLQRVPEAGGQVLGRWDPGRVGTSGRADLDARGCDQLEDVAGHLQPLGGESREVLDPVDARRHGMPDAEQ